MCRKTKMMRVLIGVVSTMILSQCSYELMKPRPVGAPERVDSDDKDIQRAVSFALSNKKLLSPLEKVTNARAQVVAGYNYSFDIKLEDGSRYHVVVYENLEGVMSVTRFELL